MSQKSRPVPTPEQRKFMEIKDSTEKAMLDKIYQAIEDAALGMAKEMQSVGLQLPSNNRDYFTLAAQQVPFVRLTVAIPTRFMAAILRSGNGSSGTASTPSITIGGKYPKQFHKSEDGVYRYREEQLQRCWVRGPVESFRLHGAVRLCLNI